MKLTQPQLRKIIKEELNEISYGLGPLSVEIPDQYVMNQLVTVIEPIGEVYDDLETVDQQEVFEEHLLRYITEYVKKWQRQREKER